MIIALAGHVDHGKTALIRALTGIDADRLPEEKKRGMTIDLGFAHTRLPSGALVGFVDVPGHERFLGNMLAGVLSIGTVLLVIAADDGPMPQTREHLSILRLTGVTDLACVLSKIDRVDAAHLAASRARAREALDQAGYDAAPMLEVSSVTGAGIPALLAYIETKAAAHGAREASGGFRLAIDRSFSPAGTGLVVTGTVASGSVSVGDRLLLSPSRLAARVRGLQVHHETVTKAQEGDRCAVVIGGPRVEKARLKRGDWLIDPGLHAPTQRIDALVRAVDDRGPRHATRVHVHFGAASLGGRVLTPGAHDFAPGEEGYVTLALDRPGACLYGDRIVLRDDATGRVIAGGQVIDPFSPGRGDSLPPRRRDPFPSRGGDSPPMPRRDALPSRRRAQREQRAASLAAHALSDPAAAFNALLDAEGWADMASFRIARNLNTDFVPSPESAARRIGAAAAPVFVSSETITDLTEALRAHLASWHTAHPDQMGPGKAELLRAAGAVPDSIAEAVLEVAREQGVLIRDGVVWRLPDHRPVLAALDTARWPKIEASLRAAALRPPRVRELAEALRLEPEEMEALLLRLERFGRLLRVAANRFFLPETVVTLGRLAHTLAAESEDGGFTAADYNKRSGIGRNLTIEVLEYLDGLGVTRRAGDLRHGVKPAEEAAG